MAAEKNMVRVLITNAVGIGYSKGKTYEVTPEEAKNLQEAGKCKVVAATGKETAAAKTGEETANVK